MPDKNLRRFEALFDFEMIGDYGPAGFQRKSRWRIEAGADGGDPDNARLPPDAGSNQKLVFGRNIFEHLAKLGSEALGGQPGCIRKKLLEPRTLQRANAELRQDFLLANALVQSAQSRIWGFACGFGVDDGRSRFIGWHQIGFATFFRLEDPWALASHSMAPGAAPPARNRTVCLAVYPPMKEVTMDWNRVEGNWKQMKGAVKQQWGKLTDDDLTQINGSQEKLEGILQERYGIAKDETRKQIDSWYRNQGLG
jgi:uncharacterized protein YjbJ (UPF0337 family)